MLSDAQARIIHAILLATDRKKESIEEKPPGITSYDLAQSPEKIANSTFKGNRKFLTDNGFIKRIERTSGEKNKKKSKKHSFPYTVTNLGIFSLLQQRILSQSRDTFLNSDFKKFVPHINDHWDDLQKIYNNKTPLWAALRKALRLIDVSPMLNLDELKKLRLWDETISFSFGDKKFSKTISYNTNTDEELKRLNSEEKLFILQSENINEIQNNILNKITFLFYFTLLLHGTFEENKTLNEFVTGKTQLKVITMMMEGRDITRKYGKPFPEIVKIIKGNSELLNIFKTNLDELTDLISVPDSLKKINSKFKT